MRACLVGMFDCCLKKELLKQIFLSLEPNCYELVPGGFVMQDSSIQNILFAIALEEGKRVEMIVNFISQSLGHNQ